MLVLTHPHLTLPKLTPHSSVRQVHIRMMQPALPTKQRFPTQLTLPILWSICRDIARKSTSSSPTTITLRDFWIAVHYLVSSVVGDERPPQLPGLLLGSIQMIVINYVSAPEGILPKFYPHRMLVIFFDEENKAKLIDFDWAGRHDMNICGKDLPVDLQKMINENVKDIVNHYVCYPLNLNLSRDINWEKSHGTCWTNLIYKDNTISCPLQRYPMQCCSPFIHHCSSVTQAISDISSDNATTNHPSALSAQLPHPASSFKFYNTTC